MAKRKYSRKKVRNSKHYKKYKKIKYSRKQKGGFFGTFVGNITSMFSSIVNVSKKIDSVPIETPALSLMLSKCNDANKELTNLIAKLKELDKKNEPPNQNNQGKLDNNNTISNKSNSNSSSAPSVGPGPPAPAPAPALGPVPPAPSVGSPGPRPGPPAPSVGSPGPRPGPPAVGDKSVKINSNVSNSNSNSNGNSI